MHFAAALPSCDAHTYWNTSCCLAPLRSQLYDLTLGKVQAFDDAPEYLPKVFV
jgi:hypothetical protein